MSVVRILFVDDEQDICSVVSNSLKRAGFEVDSFTGPAEALSAFKAGRYALALLDIKMPKMSGLDLFHELSSIDKDLKVCFLTAYDAEYREMMEQRFPDVPNECFLQKPLRMQDVILRINEELHRS